MGLVELFLPLAGAVLLGTLIVGLQARIAPRAAARLAFLFTVAVGGVGFVGSVLVTAQFFAHSSSLGAPPRWCSMLGSRAGVSTTWGVGATGLVAFGVFRMGRYLLGRHASIASYRLLRRSVTEPLAVVDDAAVFAYSIPGRQRLTIVSAGLLSTLDEAERKVVLSHEDGHHHFHHDRLLHLGAIAAALFPPVAPLKRGLAHALERWADEHAATVVGDRRLVAMTVARTALLASRPSIPAGTLGFTSAGPFSTTRRVSSLLQPPAPVPVWVIVLTGASAAALATQLHHLELIVETLCRM
jgi:Peptidase family M48